MGPYLLVSEMTGISASLSMPKESPRNEEEDQPQARLENRAEKQEHCLCQHPGPRRRNKYPGPAASLAGSPSPLPSSKLFLQTSQDSKDSLFKTTSRR